MTNTERSGFNLPTRAGRPHDFGCVPEMFLQHRHPAIHLRRAYDKMNEGWLWTTWTLCYAPGTGGVAFPWLISRATSGTYSLRASGPLYQPYDTPPRTPSLGTMVAIIRSTFGLTVTDMAAILKVERPTIYSWLREDATPLRDNRARLEKALGIANSWRSYAGETTVPDLKRTGQDGNSLFSLLCDEYIREHVITTMLRARWGAPLSLQDNREKSPASLRERAASIGLAPSSSEKEQLDLLTGRRISAE